VIRDARFEMNIPYHAARISDRFSRFSYRASRISNLVSFQFLIALAIMCAVGIGTGSVSLAADQPGQPAENPATVKQEKEGKTPLRPPQKLGERIRGATPEERARLDAERRRLSGEAASFGVDPTAIIGYYQFLYGHSVLTNNIRIDSAAATIRLPMTPNWAFQVSMPYAWADLNNSSAFPLRGARDMTTRTGGRIFANEDLAVFIGLDASFPTASEKQLGTGKYTLGPGGSLAVPLPRMRSFFNVVAADYSSVGGDPSRPNLHFTQIQPAFYTFWTDQWISGAVMTWDVDWNNGRKTTMNLLGEVAYRFTDHGIIFAGPGLGVAGRETFLGLDWTVQAGVRWVFRTPLLPQTLFQSIPINR
jgi:hypothetical protein